MSTDYFAIFEALNLEEKGNTKKQAQASHMAGQTCQHSNIIYEKGIGVCIDCGIEIGDTEDGEREWKYYGQNDTKHVCNPMRVNKRNTENGTIYKDVEGLGISDTIIATANQLYSEIAQEKIYRGRSRKSLVFACIYHSYNTNNKPQLYKHLTAIFKLDPKYASRGIQTFNLIMGKKNIGQKPKITPLDLTSHIIDLFGGTQEQKDEIAEIYDKIHNRSAELNRARPQSLAASMVFYWIKTKNKDISLKNFSSKVDLSELTINKIVKQIAKVIEGSKEVEATPVVKKKTKK